MKLRQSPMEDTYKARGIESLKVKDNYVDKHGKHV
jgi:hypothetical protein